MSKSEQHEMFWILAREPSWLIGKNSGTVQIPPQNHSFIAGYYWYDIMIEDRIDNEMIRMWTKVLRGFRSKAGTLTRDVPAPRHLFPDPQEMIHGYRWAETVSCLKVNLATPSSNKCTYMEKSRTNKCQSFLAVPVKVMRFSSILRWRTRYISVFRFVVWLAASSQAG